MKRLILILTLLFLLIIVGLTPAQTFTPSKQDVKFPGYYTHQTAGDTIAPMIYLLPATIHTQALAIDSAATASDTTYLGDVRQIIGLISSSTFDTSAVTFSVSLSGTDLKDVWKDTAVVSVNLDSDAIVWLSDPIYARNIKLTFAAQTSSATITLIYR